MRHRLTMPEAMAAGALAFLLLSAFNTLIAAKYPLAGTVTAKTQDRVLPTCSLPEALK